MEVVEHDKTEKNWLQTKLTSYFQAKTGNKKGIVLDRKNVKRNENNYRKSARDSKQFSEKLRHMYRAGINWKSGDTLDLENVVNKEIMNVEIQDFNARPVFFGGDVKALYPSLDQISTAEIAAEAIMDTGVMFEEIDYDLLAIYLLLNLGKVEKRRMGLNEVIPCAGA